MAYDPEIWLESATREIKAYVENATDLYDVIMEFPGTQLDRNKVPLTNTLIHFEIDDIQSRVLGFGDNVFNDNYNVDDGTVTPQDAVQHRISFDVGIWAFARTGGTTARMRARQLLDQLFSGAQAVDRLRDFSDSGDGTLEIMSYSGGRFVNDTVNDVPVYRSVNASLEIRVFSRTPISATTPMPVIEQVDQSPDLTIIG